MAAARDDLASFVADVAGLGLRVEENLGAGFVRLRVDEAERRQAAHDIRCIEDVIIELLRNSRDAHASHIFVATAREGTERTVVVIDDGDGIPESLQDRVFDARVTSKLNTMHMDRWGVHGRGMALFSVKTNVETAEVVASEPDLGCALRVVSDTERLSERADQSSWPTLTTNDEGAPQLRGPHNMARACAEFALDEEDVCDVYFGSPAEMVATARRRMRPQLTTEQLIFLDDVNQFALLERLSLATDAQELAELAGKLGLVISERTAQRILSGHIKPVRSTLARVSRGGQERRSSRKIDLTVDRRGLKLAKDDAEEFSRIMARDFDWLAERYYLELAGQPRVSAGRGKVIVTFDLAQDD